MADPHQELVVRGEPVERVFAAFRSNRYLVNRRYQRKLIWTLEEKQKFIDSIAHGLPVPIILLAETVDRSTGSLEIIDGMQRLNAITSYIENEYSIDNGYFDLNTFAATKDLLDRGELKQREPVLPRDICLAIAAYPLPLSIYETSNPESVDEVFRRINSGGRQLSRQELRVAGAVNSFAECVRIISSELRGDASSTDVLSLSDMKNISITNRDLQYGIKADNVFWVVNNIVTRDQLRQSRDEELVADLVAYMASDEPTASRTELFDDYYGSSYPFAGVREERHREMDLAVRKRTTDLLAYDFRRVFDEVILTLDQSEKTFSELLFADNNGGNPVPRYFQAVFLALHDIMVKNNKTVSDRAGVIRRLSDNGRNITIQEGGRWGADNRSAAVQSVVGMLNPYFEESDAPDPAKVHWVTKLQNLLISSKTEQSAYDFKQGFLTLSDEPSFDEASFEKILETCVAIANISPSHKGYVVVGVSENASTARRVERIFGTKILTYSGYYVGGVEHEADMIGKSLDNLFHDVTDRVRVSGVSEPLRSHINSRLKSVRYYEKTVFVFEVAGQNQPSLFNGKYVERQGTQTREVKPEDYPSFFARFR